VLNLERIRNHFPHLTRRRANSKQKFEFEFLSVHATPDFLEFFENTFTKQNKIENLVRKSQTAVYRDHITNAILEMRKDIKSSPEKKCVFIGLSFNILLNSLLSTKKILSSIWIIDKLDANLFDGSNKSGENVKEFAKRGNVTWIQENIPAGLSILPEGIDLFHLDTANPQAELSSLPIIFSKLNPTGIIILDTFFSTSNKLQHHTLIGLAKEHDMQISIFPTTQIIMTKCQT
jgi:hypothetical protein